MMVKETLYEYEAVRDLAIHIWEKHFKEDAPEWEPCDNLLAVLTQIDNMVTGLTKKRSPLPDCPEEEETLYVTQPKDKEVPHV